MKDNADGLSHNEIALRCMKYLTLLARTFHPPQILDNDLLFDYASSHWGHHIRLGNETLSSQVVPFLQQDGVLALLDQSSSLEGDFGRGILHHCAMFGLEKTTKQVLEEGEGVILYLGTKIYVLHMNLLREDLLELYHSTVLVHPGIAKTYNKLSQDYWWPKMCSDIYLYITHCPACQIYKDHTQ